MVYLIFGILGVQLFGGRLYHCTSECLSLPPPFCRADLIARLVADLSPALLANVTTKDQCLSPAFNGTWINQRQHFDNILNSVLTLFEVSTLEGWLGVMRTCVDAVDVDVQPQQNYQLEASAFFIVFLIITAFFLNGLFIGVVFGERTGRGVLLCRAQSHLLLCDVRDACASLRRHVHQTARHVHRLRLPHHQAKDLGTRASHTRRAVARLS